MIALIIDGIVDRVWHNFTKDQVIAMTDDIPENGILKEVKHAVPGMILSGKKLKQPDISGETKTEIRKFEAISRINEVWQNKKLSAMSYWLFLNNKKRTIDEQKDFDLLMQIEQWENDTLNSVNTNDDWPELSIDAKEFIQTC